MSDSPNDIPAFSALAADPEIAPLLDFEPVARKVKRPDGWTPALQRELIARLAATGTLQAAVWQMGKHATGAEALYKTPSADSFRASWDAAIVIGRRRNGLDCAPPFTREVPGITRRAPPSRSRPQGDPHPQDDEEDNLELKLEIAQRITVKFLRKVQAEREARLAGEIVAADFFLRQITALEVALDLLAQDCGYSGFELLRNCRRGGHNLFDIAETPFTQLLDAERRRQWQQLGEPMRPDHPPEKYLEQFGPSEAEGHDGYSLEPTQATGPASRPPPGVDPHEWATMGWDAQRLVLQGLYLEEAKAQAEWERESTEGKTNDGAADASA